MKNEALTNHLHDSFIHCGEILPAADIARIIREHEFDLAVEFDAQTVLASVREAGERFVDSMVQNEHDTEEAVTDGLYCGFPIDPLEARVAKWEAMRPSGNTMNHTPHNMTTTLITFPIDSENRQLTFRKVGEVWQGVERDTLRPNSFTLIDVDSDLAADLERIATKL